MGETCLPPAFSMQGGASRVVHGRDQGRPLTYTGMPLLAFKE